MRGYILDGNTLRLNSDQLGWPRVFAREGSGGTLGLPDTGGGGRAVSVSGAGVALLGGTVGLFAVSSFLASE